MAPNSQLEPCIDLIQGEIVNAQELIKQPNLTWVSSTTNNQYIKELLKSWIEWDKIEKIQEMIEWENIISFEWDYRSYAEGLEENNEMRIQRMAKIFSHWKSDGGRDLEEYSKIEKWQKLVKELLNS